MEPMNLGSSPSSPTAHHASFLPAFLMGEHKTPTQTPDKAPQHQSFARTPTQPVGTQKLFKPFPNTSENQQSTPSQAIVTESSTPNKPGPPKHGLFDTLRPSTPVGTPNNNRRQTIGEEPTASTSFSPYVNRSVHIADSFNTNETIHCETNPNMWVTVFGFSSSSLSIVLARLSSCGTIVDKRQPTQGNWVHIKFSSQYEAAKALTLNGKLMSNCVMVGVVAYNPAQEIRESSTICSTAPVLTNGYVTPVRARPLRQSLTSPQNSSTILQEQITPQRSAGIVTKAMEYVFGW